MRPGISWLDVKLGARMLSRYPGLTLMGGLGMAVAIALGAVFFEVRTALFPDLPLDEGDRVVAIESWDAAINNQERRILHDFAAWRGELRTVRELGAYREIARNLITADGQPEAVSVAEMTASGFRLARVPPLLGRTLVEEDEHPGAPPVVVIGHEVWRTRFAADSAVIGRDVRLGSTVHTVVGVMPEGFAFPLNHRFWTALRTDPSPYARRHGPGIRVFGRLAPGVTLQQAQAELAAVGQRHAAAVPQTHAQLRPRVVPYTVQLFDDFEGWEFTVMQLLLILLLVVVCANVAVLVYARTATRMGEIAVRTALGASRRRIVGQLFAEALVLALAAGVVGLLAARLAFRHVDAITDPMGTVPFWMDFGLSRGTVVYVLGVTILGAVIVGVVPALKATGGRVQTSLQQLSAGAGAGMRLGRTWTVLIVAQVAFAVAVLPAAVYFAWDFVRYGMAEPGFAAEQYLAAELLMDREAPPTAEAEAYERAFAARYADRQAELLRRVRADPGEVDVTVAADLPGQEATVRVEVDGGAAAASAAGHEVRSGRVEAGFFGAFEVPVLAGRGFQSADLDSAATAVVANQAFVRDVLGGGAALGRRVRYVGGYRAGGVEQMPQDVQPERWYEIVGVVGDFPNAMKPGSVEARLYHPMAPGQVYAAVLAVRMEGAGAGAFTGRLREVTAALDPALRVRQPRPMDQALRALQVGLRMAALAIALVTLSVLGLSAAGIYALMSFTVAQRRREIGIRAALGADPRRILRGIFSRAAGQLGLGLAVGLAAAFVLDRSSGGGLLNGNATVLLPGVCLLMMTVGLLATLGPARRGLRIQPMEALRDE